MFRIVYFTYKLRFTYLKNKIIAEHIPQMTLNNYHNTVQKNIQNIKNIK